MTDTQLFALLDAMGAQLTDGNRKYVHTPGRILAFTRVGKFERWSLAPSRDVHPIAELPSWWPRSVRTWAARAESLNVVAYAHAMGAHVL